MTLPSSGGRSTRGLGSGAARSNERWGLNLMLRNSSRTGDVVADVFLGSGSTLIAAEQLGRRCFVIELDARYVDVTVRRWEQFTGKAAVLV
jgi:DNA modification methylase